MSRTVWRRFWEAQEIAGRDLQCHTYPVNERKARLDLGALVASVTVLLDAENSRELASVSKTPFGSKLPQAPRELNTHRWR